MAILVGRYGDRLSSPEAAPIAVAADVSSEISHVRYQLEREAEEVARLARENSALAAELEDARRRLAEREVTLTMAVEQLEEMRRPMGADTFSSTLRAELKSGEVVVTGGYQLPSGRRIYAFATPKVEVLDGSSNVRVETQLIEIDDQVSKSVGLDSIATNAANTLQHGEVWVADEYKSVGDKIEATGQFDRQVLPDLQVEPGASGSLSVGNLKLKITPVVLADGQSINLDVRMEQPQLPANSPSEPANQPPK